MHNIWVMRGDDARDFCLLKPFGETFKAGQIMLNAALGHRVNIRVMRARYHDLLNTALMKCLHRVQTKGLGTAGWGTSDNMANLKIRRGHNRNPSKVSTLRIA